MNSASDAAEVIFVVVAFVGLETFENWIVPSATCPLLGVGVGVGVGVGAATLPLET